ncbi:tripartite tricarboxylate transporter substrate binding protein (plasmid) [Cupriavidus necator]|uniref:Tripartite tricarboxylate transporter substrate binding protein n=1 Tax=Cupriavidus necator TaxID=106590 RepID=A0A1U9V2I2_CUPNE|nr:tripartite tricarboxylate transporter substrate binding protein [Cupriavidus necator]AQV99166.1 tripartite tricarboxylate transporter substrate binding protein [Cupriavidus necator]
MGVGTILRVLAIVGFSAISIGAKAQEYPARPIRILVGFAAGGGVDTVARLYAAKLQEVLNVPIVVENKPGASELLAALPLTRAAPDDYTLWMTSASSLVRGPGVRTDLPYDPLKQLTFISRVAEVEALYVVKPSLPVHSVRELIDYAKQHPGKLNYGSAGIGSSNHLLTEQFRLLTKIDMVHVPFKSDAEVARELTGGTLDFAMAITTFSTPFVKDGRIRAVAVTGPQRLAELPDVPTLEESDVPEVRGLGTYLFYGLVGPAGMSPVIVKKLNDALTKIAQTPEMAQKLRTVSMRPAFGSPPDFRRLIESEIPRWKEVGKTVKNTNS